MMSSKLFGRTLGALTLGLSAMPASAQTQTYVDLQGGVGFSSNPLLVVGDQSGSAFGRVSASAYHGWTRERSATSLSAYIENSNYFRRFGNKQLFSLNAATSRAVSETLRVHGSAGFSGDFGAQLGSRFYGVPAESVLVDPTLPNSFVNVVNIDLNALNRRQYRLSGEVGFNLATSPRDTFNGSIGANRTFFNRNGGLLNFHAFDTSLGYQRRLSEFVSVGARVIATRAEYDAGRSSTSYGPQATFDARVGNNWQASLAAGVVRTEQNLGLLGSRSDNVDLAVDASLCRALEYERMCARASRRSQATAIGVSPTTSLVGADYSRRLSAKDQIQATFFASRTDGARGIGLGRQTFFNLAGNYDRRISERLAVGVNATGRKVSQAGVNPKDDIGASAFIRYRLGNVR